MFDAILGGDASDPPGNTLLNQLTIIPDTPNVDGDYACDDASTMAATRGWSLDTPVIIFCDQSGLGHGGIGKGYDTADPPVDAVVCEDFDPRVSWKMTTAGSILLHEYTHFQALVTSNNGGPLQGSTGDDAWGAFDCRNLDKSMATTNADSYAWFATEVLWTVICQTDYQDPNDQDDDDPNCDDGSCTDPGDSPE